jgi:hypothetical protein
MDAGGNDLVEAEFSVLHRKNEDCVPNINSLYIISSD